MFLSSYIFLAYLLILLGTSAIAFVNFSPSWSSLDKRILPKWYHEAKVGIFVHWGVYSVPSFGDEWIIKGDFRQNMRNHYGPKFSYQQFAGQLSADLFNASHWALLFRDSGARYVVLTAKHHDGFTLWPSTFSSYWNSVDIGPMCDVVGILASAIRSTTSLKFGVYYSLMEWSNRLYTTMEASKESYVIRKVIQEMKELVVRYKPDIFWSDGEWDAHSSYWNAEKFVAWLYNNSSVRNSIVTNDRWGRDARCKHGDFHTCDDAYNPGVYKAHKWENAFSILNNSWGLRFDVSLNNFKTSAELIAEIVKTVSCNGNVLINISPTKYGTILPIFEERLRDMGDWLYTNGEAIYGTDHWIFQQDTVAKDVWYTQKKFGCIYAIVTKYPYESNEINLYSAWHFFNPKKMNGSYVFLLGMEDLQVEWKLMKNHLNIVFPPKNHIDKRDLKYAWTFKLITKV